MNLLFPELELEYKKINGLTLIENYINEKEEQDLISLINNQTWICELKRRVQHYGYKYDYVTNKVTNDPVPTIPEFLYNLCMRLYNEGIFLQIPNQIIINEYLPGLGIASHIDVESFSETICSLSLNSDIIMNLSKEESIDLMLKRKSLLILKSDARYKWKHGIIARKTDKYFGLSLKRERRISITFRTRI